MDPSQKQFDQLVKIAKPLRILEGIASHLDWDQETYMPPGAAQIREEQLKVLAGMIHRQKTH